MSSQRSTVEKAIEKAKKEIPVHLDRSLREGRIDEQLHAQATVATLSNLGKWMGDPNVDRIAPHLKDGALNYIESGRWTDIVNAYRQDLRFGTGGIRGMMAFDRDSITQMYEQGLDVPILKGPNTLNEMVLLRVSVGVAKYGREAGYNAIVIGYDSRVRGRELAEFVARLFLHKKYGYTVFFFDAACPYPEVTFAIPDLKANPPAAVAKALTKKELAGMKLMGILISASHNDYRYNGYKLSCENGSQFDPDQRERMYNDFIMKAKTSEIALCPFSKAPQNKLWFLGGDAPVAGFDYLGREQHIINMHVRHRNHVCSFLKMPDLREQQQAARSPLTIGYCAFHGAGTIAVPRLLKDVGFRSIWEITHKDLNVCNGLFPSFCSDPGKEQQPDPGDPRAANTAVEAFAATAAEKHYPVTFGDLDILIGTDPDADRCGVVAKVPAEQQSLYGGRDWTLLSADELWALIIWYRMEMDKIKAGKRTYREVPGSDRHFITLSVTTSDSIIRMALANGVGVVKTWVGFASLSAATRDIWSGRYKHYANLRDGRTDQGSALTDPVVCECYGIDAKRSINLGAMEQSNGFSILGGRPPNSSSLGKGGHVRDKDGTFAALLAAEIAAWAKQQGTTVFELIDEKIHLNPDIGLFVSGYEPDPLDGEYPGIEGDRIKKAVLRRALGLFQMARAGDLELAGMPVKSACIYRTGKYDAIYPPTYDFQFPDEGIRFHFDDERVNHVTIRPSGTGNSLRFHTQLHADVNRSNLLEKKKELRERTTALFEEIRIRLKAPRS